MNPRGYNEYVNWVLYAIYGKMAEADAIMRQSRSLVVAFARQLQKLFPVSARTLYRGVLLSPSEIVHGTLPPDPRLTFVSFSEDRDVACWFADVQSYVSGAVVQQRRGIEGYLITHRPHVDDILFHHRWGMTFPLPGGQQRGPLTVFAQRHPLIDATQFDWNLRTQREVILQPSAQPLPVEPLRNCPATELLDERLLMPTFR